MAVRIGHFVDARGVSKRYRSGTLANDGIDFAADLGVGLDDFRLAPPSLESVYLGLGEEPADARPAA
jgi:hypothetical protein